MRPQRLAISTSRTVLVPTVLGMLTTDVAPSCVRALEPCSSPEHPCL